MATKFTVNFSDVTRLEVDGYFARDDWSLRSFTSLKTVIFSETFTLHLSRLPISVTHLEISADIIKLTYLPMKMKLVKLGVFCVIPEKFNFCNITALKTVTHLAFDPWKVEKQVKFPSKLTHIVVKKQAITNYQLYHQEFCNTGFLWFLQAMSYAIPITTMYQFKNQKTLYITRLPCNGKTWEVMVRDIKNGNFKVVKSKMIQNDNEGFFD